MTKVIILLFGILMSFTCCQEQQVTLVKPIEYDIVTQTYLKAYLDSTLTDTASLDYKNYTQYLKKELEKLPVSNSRLDSLLTNYGFTNTKVNILDSLRARTCDLNSIECLLSYDKVKFTNSRTEEIFKATYSNLKQQYTSNKTPLDKSFENMWILQLIIMLVILILCVYLLLQQKKLKDDIKYIEHEVDRLSNTSPSVKADNNQVTLLSQKCAKIEKQLAALENEIKKIAKNQPVTEVREKSVPVEIVSNPIPLVVNEEPTPSSVAVYAKAVSGGVLKEGVGNAFVYRIFDAKNGLVNFEFVSTNISYVLENKNAIFDNVAECKGNSMSATNIKSIKPGTAKEIEQGRWEVVTKTQVEFIK